MTYTLLYIIVKTRTRANIIRKSRTRGKGDGGGGNDDNKRNGLLELIGCNRLSVVEASTRYKRRLLFGLYYHHDVIGEIELRVFPTGSIFIFFLYRQDLRVSAKCKTQKPLKIRIVWKQNLSGTAKLR